MEAHSGLGEHMDDPRFVHIRTQSMEVMVLPGVAPRWDVSHDAKGRVTLHPSVWRRDGCRSHSWLRAGKIVWCD